ncbi:MAG: Gfo/Idh/MocA family oxidoreductase [Eubacterium sp.]|nr:Gfo/Idh/MocA family oxidoreductase [Eubacterium sp.]
MEKKQFRVGAVGCGIIARKFAEAANQMDGVEIAGVTDAFPKSAAQYAREYRVGKVCGSFEELLELEDLDLIYIATPNHTHYDLTRQALLAGKNVLCEKPMTIDAEKTEELAALAKKQNCILAEGLWTKTLPIYREIKKIITEGQIGEVHVLTADYFFRAPLDPASRLFNLEMGGGALLDIGIYELVLVSMVMGSDPVEIKSVSKIGETGVDEITGVLLKFANGSVASLMCAIRTPAPYRATIIGTRGRIDIQEFGRAERGMLYRYSSDEGADGNSSGKVGVRRNVPEQVEEIPLNYPHSINGFEYEIEALRRAVRAGEKECPELSLRDTIGVHRMIDQIKSVWQGQKR